MAFDLECQGYVTCWRKASLCSYPLSLSFYSMRPVNMKWPSLFSELLFAQSFLVWREVCKVSNATCISPLMPSNTSLIRPTLEGRYISLLCPQEIPLDERFELILRHFAEAELVGLQVFLFIFLGNSKEPGVKYVPSIGRMTIEMDER